MKHKAESPPVTTGRVVGSDQRPAVHPVAHAIARPVVIVQGSAVTAEMLHTFFCLMELDPIILAPAKGLSGHSADSAADALPDRVCRLDPAAVVIDCEILALRGLDLALELRRRHPSLPIALLTDSGLPPHGFPSARIPHGDFEDLLAVMEAVLA